MICDVYVRRTKYCCTRYDITVITDIIAVITDITTILYW